MEPRAIIILYTGESTTVAQQASIVKFLHQENIIASGTEPKVYELNSEDLAGLAIKEVCDKKEEMVGPAVKAAYDYIVENNANLLANKEYFTFSLNLSEQMKDDKRTRDSVDLIISTPNVESYGVNKTILSRIKSVSQFYVQKFRR